MPDSKRIFGNYEVLARLGRGGMAEVFKARVIAPGPREGQLVALKRLLPELVQDLTYVDRFTNEADLTKWLDHPGIVRTLEVGCHREVYFIAMEWVDGRDLDQILRRCRKRGIRLPADFVLFVVHELLMALDYAHNAKHPTGKSLSLVHCDVSPSNVFISRSGEVKLGDFGVAQAHLLSEERADASTVEGKAFYLSPEALQGKISPALDVWAAAVVLYEALTLERPFEGGNPEEVLAAIAKRSHIPVQTRCPELPAALASVVERTFAAKAKDRYQTAAELAQALKPHFDERVGTPMGIAALVRGLFDTEGP